MSQLDPVGSYAGAMGLGGNSFAEQYSARYAVDFDGDVHRDIMDKTQQDRHACCQFITAHGWQPGQSIVHADKKLSGNDV